MAERPIVSVDGRGLSREQIECNFGDLHQPLDATQANAESDRCLYCYDAPCVRACPTSIDIPTFIHQIRTENTDGAAKTILAANIMGGTCARVCPTEILCEEACVRNTSEDKPVEIGALQRFAVDHFMAGDHPHPFVRAEKTDKNVAVVGAGPAGLACAHKLAMLGHDVTVYEARPKSGGLNEYGLAAYKMVDDFAQREVDFLLQIGGIEIKHDMAFGKDIHLLELQEKHDAVFIGVGLTDTNSVGLPGDDLPGVEDAIDFIAELRQANHPADMKMPDNIVVIGGGNTAIDAAVQAKRLGARDVTLVYRRGAANMSATEWEQDLAQTNGVIVKYWSSPVSFDGDGSLTSVTFERTAVSDSGRLEGTGSTYSVSADLALLAIGQKLDSANGEQLTIDRGKIVVGDDYQTSVSGVFAGGDCIASGEDLTVQAVEDGKCAAHAIDLYLKNT